MRPEEAGGGRRRPVAVKDPSNVARFRNLPGPNITLLNNYSDFKNWKEI